MGCIFGTTLAIAAAEQVLDLLVAKDPHLGGRYGCSIAAAIDVLDACHVAVLDDYLDHVVGSGNIVSLVAAAIDGRHVVGVLCLSGCGHRLFHMHLDMSLRRAVQVVAAEDLARQQVVATVLGRRQRGAVERHVDVAAHVGLDCQYGVLGGNISLLTFGAYGCYG